MNASDLSPWILLIIELGVLGLATGFLAGLLGIGGGMIMVPFLTYILSSRGISADLTVKMAIATSMATIIFTSLSSVRAHHKRGAVRWDIVRTLAPGIVVGAMVASLGVFAVIRATGSHLSSPVSSGSQPTKCFATNNRNQVVACQARRDFLGWAAALAFCQV